MKRIILILLLLIPAPVLAYRTEIMNNIPADNYFSIGPGTKNFTANPGDTMTGEIQILSRNEKKYTYAVSAEEYATSGDQDFSADWLKKYSAKPWIKTEVGTIDLTLGEKAFVNYTVKVPAQADVGDHYAVVCGTELHEFNRPEGETKKSEPTVNIQASSCQVVTVTVPGDKIDSGKLESFKPYKKWFEATPAKFEILFKNEGNTTLSPSGTINVTGWMGQKETVEITAFRSLRDSLRRQGAEAFRDKKFRFGKFTATLELKRGYGDEVDKKTVEFWIIPWRQLLQYVAILIVALIALKFIGSRISVKVGKK